MSGQATRVPETQSGAHTINPKVDDKTANVPAGRAAEDDHLRQRS
jgi:hypothetical protein